MKVCSKCNCDKPLTDFYQRKSNSTGRSKAGSYSSACKKCVCDRATARRTEDPEHAKAIVRKASRVFRQKNAEAERKRLNDYYWANTDRFKVWAKNWAAENPHMRRANEALRRSALLNAMPVWADREQIKVVYANAQAKTREMGELHHVDHIVPLKGRLVCGLHVQGNLQVIPARQNLSKGNRLPLENFHAN